MIKKRSKEKRDLKVAFFPSPLDSFLHLNVHWIYFLFVLSSSFNTAPSHFCRRGLIAGLREQRAPGWRAAERGPTLSFTRVKLGSAMGKAGDFPRRVPRVEWTCLPLSGAIMTDAFITTAMGRKGRGGKLRGLLSMWRGIIFVTKMWPFNLFFLWFADFDGFMSLWVQWESSFVSYCLTHRGFSV